MVDLRTACMFAPSGVALDVMKPGFLLKFDKKKQLGMLVS